MHAIDSHDHENTIAVKARTHSASQCQAFKFKEECGRRDLKMSKIIYADAPSGKLVLGYCNKCQTNWRDLFSNMKRMCGITIMNKRLNSFS